MPAVDPAGVHFLTTDDQPADSRQYVLYWMQQSQRAVHNPALEYAIARANDLELPLLAVFGLMDDSPTANLRPYTFVMAVCRVVRVG